MSNLALEAHWPLDRFEKYYSGNRIAEVCNRSIVSIATPRGGEVELAKAISDAYSVEVPAPGNSSLSAHQNARFLGLAADQLFVVFDDPGPFPEKAIASELGAAAYLVDQSDSWVVMSARGPRVRDALERICPIDIHPDAFTEGQVARTVMEHLSVVIVRDGPESYLLLSPRSSAHTFLDALETSFLNVL